MPTELTIRPERPADHDLLGDLITAAFDGRPYADGDEAELLVALRRADALALSLVAESQGDLIGQAAFSPARPADGKADWYALGPVAVLPAHQRTGVGTRLVLEGLEIITSRGANGCIVVGDPAYYTRFGFEVAPAHAPIGQPADFFMVKLLGGARPDGPIEYHAAFGGTN